jgi:hypothetical protein
MRLNTQAAWILRVAVPVLALGLAAPSFAQQTLGNINGTVTDISGAVVAGAKVQITGENNGITLTTVSGKNGRYQFQNLPVGLYTLLFTETGFEVERVPSVPVQEDRTGTINAALRPGSEGTTIDVTEHPLLNETDATNGYVLDAQTIQETPLATGSFTRLATLAPGVSGELIAGIGTATGLGNQPIWANGQRDTSNGFNVDGVDVTNLFNGKSSSQDQSQRYNFNIGSGQESSVAGQSVTNTSVYGSNGNSLATPPPDFIQQLTVNTSEYDASEGNHSGAQINVNTMSGSNVLHGNGYATRATNFANAAPYFNKQSGPAYLNSIPQSFVIPQLHRDIIGGTLAGPIFKNKLFFALGYQYEHDADALKGYSSFSVPYDPGTVASGTKAADPCSGKPAVGLTDDRSTTGILNAATAYNCVTQANGGTTTTAPTTIDPVALALLTAKLSNGQYLIPSAQNTSNIASAVSNVFINSGALFRYFAAHGALDYNVTPHDRLSAKYYYQFDPSLSPFANANTFGFPALEDNGAQVTSLVNTITLGSHINWEQRIGLSRQKSYSTFKPQTANGTYGIGFPGGTSTPAISLGDFSWSSGSSVTIGPNSTFADTGYFQNRLTPESSVIFILGKHNLTAGGNFNYTQLNIHNLRANLGSVSTSNFITFLTGAAKSSNYLTGNSNRYYRANDVGAYVQDQWRLLSNLSVTAGVRYDYNGGFTEKYGDMFNFSPALYAQNGVGFVVAGNNAFDPTAGTSNSTLTGRQWGIAPRLGFAYTPKQNGGKVVFHGSVGMFYDRGEYFSYLSQPAGSSTGGPFGVTEAPPLVNYVTGTGTLTLENPLGSTVVPASSSNPATFASKIVTAAAIRAGCAGLVAEEAGGDCPVQPYNFGAYAAGNKLPYIIDFSFGTQFQVSPSTSVSIGYVGNLGRHGVIPVPFNEPGIATPTNPINGETSSYGYEVLNQATPVVVGGKNYYAPISTEPYNTYDGGNIDLRVPYVGYSPNAALFTAAGVSSFNSLQVHVDRRMSKNVSFGLSYTFSHALDEQSDLGLFFTGDNPDHLRDSYASADFDRTNILVFNYVVKIPGVASNRTLLSRFTNGWQVVGITTLQSGEPYSLYEYDGAVGSLYFGNYPTLANPVLGIKNGKNPNSAKTGAPGTQLLPNGSGGYVYQNEINTQQLSVNLLQPGQKGIPSCTANEPCDYFENDFTPGQRNIFRQSYQKDADISLQKITHLTERVVARYTFDIYNFTNSSSFDVPNNSASISQSDYAGPATAKANKISYGQVNSSVATNLSDVNNLYVIPNNNTTSTFGSVRNTIGLPRTIEMSLHVQF